jgi:glycosyltransferase involved in cell wall biosynthesis
VVNIKPPQADDTLRAQQYVDAGTSDAAAFAVQRARKAFGSTVDIGLRMPGDRREIISDGTREIVLIYFSFFPSEFAVGPAITVKRLAMHLARYFPVRILTLNYDLTNRRPLFLEPHHILEEDGYTVEYLPYDVRRYRYLFRYLRNSSAAIGLNCLFDYRLAIPAFLIHKVFGRSKYVVHFPHGIFLDAVFAQKHLKKLLFCRAFDILRLGRNLFHVASCEQESRDIQRSLSTRQNIMVLPHFGQAPARGVAERATPKRSGELRVCFVGRIAGQKNLIGAIDILAQLQIPCEFDIIGAVEDEGYYRRCLNKIRSLPEGIVVRFLGAIPHSELTARLGHYHLFFSPTLGENFGHAILEALACGVPALVSDQTPWTDLDAHRAGWVVKLSSPERFVEILEEVFRMGPELARAPAAAYAATKANPPGLEQALLAAFGVSLSAETTNQGGEAVSNARLDGASARHQAV